MRSVCAEQCRVVGILLRPCRTAYGISRLSNRTHTHTYTPVLNTEPGADHRVALGLVDGPGSSTKNEDRVNCDVCMVGGQDAVCIGHFVVDVVSFFPMAVVKGLAAILLLFLLPTFREKDWTPTSSSAN